MTLSFKDLLPFLVLVGTSALAVTLGLPFWATIVVTTAVCSAVLGVRTVIARRVGAAAAARPHDDDPERAAAQVSVLLRRLATDAQFHDRGLFITFTLPGADASTVLSGQFRREEGGVWPVWRHMGNMCVEVPARYLADDANDSWRRFVARLPRGLQRWRMHGVLVLAPLSGDAARDQGARLVQARTAALLQRIGATAPTYVILSGAETCVATTANGVDAALTRLDESAPRGWGATVPAVESSEVPARAVTMIGDLALRFARCALFELGDVAVARVDDLIKRRTHRDRRGFVDITTHALDHDAAPRTRPKDAGWRATAAAPLRLLAHADGVKRLTSRLFAADAQSGLRFAGLFLVAARPADEPAYFAAGALACIAGNGAQRAAPSAHALTHRRRRTWRLAAAVTTLLLVLAAVAVRGWLRDGAATTQAWSAFREFQRAGHTPLPILPARQFAGQIQILERKDPAWLAPTLGLDSRPRLTSTLRRHLHGIVHSAVFVPVVRQVEQTLRHRAQRRVAAPDTAALLAFYLLATWLADTPAGRLVRRGPGEPDPSATSGLRTFIGAAVLTRGDTLPPGQQDVAVNLLADEFRAMQLRHPRLPRDETLVETIRAQLLQQQATACTWPEIRRSIAPQPLSLATLLAVTDRTIDLRADSTPDESHTARGMRRVLTELDGPRCVAPPAWVLGLTEAEAAARARTLRTTVLRHYAAAFVSAWQHMYASLGLATPDRKCDTLFTALRRFADREGQLYRLSHVLHTELQALPSVSIGVGMHDPLTQLLAHAAPTPTEDPAALIRTGLAPYVNLLTARPGPLDGPAKIPIESLFAALEQFTALEHAPGATLDQLYLDALAAIVRSYSGFAPEVQAMYRRLLDPLIAGLEPCFGQTTGLPAWCTEVAQPFQLTLGGYPINDESPLDVAIADLCPFFCHERGAAWRYFREHLADRLILRAKGSFIAANDHGPSSMRHHNTRELAAFYTRVRTISQLLFVGTDTTPRVRFAVYVPPIAAPGVEIAEVQFVVGTTSAAFNNTRPRWQDLEWPGTEGGASLVVRGRYHGAEITGELATEGPWALFRLLQAAPATRDGHHLTYTFSMDELPGVPIVVELRTTAAELFVDASGKAMGAWRIHMPAKDHKRDPACVL